MYYVKLCGKLNPQPYSDMYDAIKAGDEMCRIAGIGPAYTIVSDTELEWEESQKDTGRDDLFKTRPSMTQSDITLNKIIWILILALAGLSMLFGK